MEPICPVCPKCKSNKHVRPFKMYSDNGWWCDPCDVTFYQTPPPVKEEVKTP
jgi:transposase-like protein